MLLALLFRDKGLAVHVGDEDLGDSDAAIGLLVILEDGDVGAPYSEARAIEGVEIFGFFCAGGAVADVCAAGLEVGEVGTGADLAVEALAGQPDFEVVGLRGAEAHVAGREEHTAVGETEEFEDTFGVASEGLMLVAGLFASREFDELDLLELVLADHAADVFAVAAGFAAEAWCPGAEGDGELRFVEGLVAEEVGDGDLSGGDEPVIAILKFAGVGALVVAVKGVFGELRELAGPEEGTRVDHEGREDFGVSVLAGVEIEHEVGEGALEARSGAVVDDETGAGDFSGPVEVEDVEVFAEIPVRFRGEVEGGLSAPGFLLAVGMFVGADGNGVLGEVWDGLEDGLEAFVCCGGPGFEFIHLRFKSPGLLGLSGGIGSGFAEAGDLFGELIALGLEGFDLGDGFAALAIDRGEVSEDDGGVHAPGAQFFLYNGQVGPDEG